MITGIMAIITANSSTMIGVNLFLWGSVPITGKLFETKLQKTIYTSKY